MVLNGKEKFACLRHFVQAEEEGTTNCKSESITIVSNSPITIRIEIDYQKLLYSKICPFCLHMKFSVYKSHLINWKSDTEHV